MSPHERSILMIHRYYQPDAPPYGHFLHDIAGWLRDAGYRVTVLSTQPSYNRATARTRLPTNRVEEGVTVHRMRLLPECKEQLLRRVVNTVLFLVAVFLRVARRRDDLVTFSTMPPVVLGLTVRLALALTGRRGQFVYHCQDLYPEAAASAGLTAGQRLLRHLDASTMRASSATIVLSDDMRRTVLDRGVPDDRLRVINNYPLGSDPSTADERRARTLLPDTPRPLALFAGNLGRFQSLEVILQAAQVLEGRGMPATFVFMGDGAARPQLQADAGSLLGTRVHLAGYQPPEVAAAAMTLADIGLVTLRAGMLDAAFPSKTFTYLRAGCPILLTSPPGASMAQEIITYGIGQVCPPGDPDALADAITAMGCATPSQREAARAFVRNHASAEVASSAWLAVMHELEASLWT